MANLAHTVAEFAVAAAISATSVVGGVALSTVGLVFTISNENQAKALNRIQGEHKDRSIAMIGGYWARRGMATPSQNERAIMEFVAKHGGTAWVVRWPREGDFLLWHYKKDFAPKKGSALFIRYIARGKNDGNQWATNP